MVAADFNQDGNTDLAVDNYGIINQPTTQTLTLLLGNGQGGFTQAGPPSPTGRFSTIWRLRTSTEMGPPTWPSPTWLTSTPAFCCTISTQTETASVSNITVAGTATHYVDAVYLGNTSFASSTSTTVPLQGLAGHIPRLTLSANPIQQMVTMPVTFTAQLAFRVERASFCHSDAERSPSMIRVSGSRLELRPWGQTDRQFTPPPA